MAPKIKRPQPLAVPSKRKKQPDGLGQAKRPASKADRQLPAPKDKRRIDAASAKRAWPWTEPNPEPEVKSRWQRFSMPIGSLIGVLAWWTKIQDAYAAVRSVVPEAGSVSDWAMPIVARLLRSFEHLGEWASQRWVTLERLFADVGS